MDIKIAVALGLLLLLLLACGVVKEVLEEGLVVLVSHITLAGHQSNHNVILLIDVNVDPLGFKWCHKNTWCLLSRLYESFLIRY